MADHDAQFEGPSEAASPVEDGGPAFVFTAHMPMIVDSTGLTAEAIRSLRSTLLAQHVQQGRRALAICAPSAGAGCSFLSANLAVAMAEAGVETLLVDANLRDPALHDYIAPPAPIAGLVECLQDPERPLGGVIQRVQPSLSVLYAGDADAAAGNLLSASAFRSVVATCLRDYELTIFDTPSANRYADVQRIASAARYALVVACKQRTFMNDVRTLISDLESNHTTVVGTYLNEY